MKLKSSDFNRSFLGEGQIIAQKGQHLVHTNDEELCRILMRMEGYLLRKCSNFAKNLEFIRKIKDMSLYEFSQELDIPKSTLKYVIKEGNTSLETAVHIAESMDISIDALLRNDLDVEKHDVLMKVLKDMEWFSQKSPEIQRELKCCIEKLLDCICDEASRYDECYRD